MISLKSAAELVSELNETDETEQLEAKSASEAVGKSVFETICALANEPGLEGGTILLGVDKELALFPLYTASGVKDPDKISADIASGCASMFNNPIRPEIRTEKVGRSVVIRINVPELAAHQKPLYFVNRGLPKGAYRRVGSTDQHCTEEDLLLFYQGKDASAFDTTVVHDATLEDIDPDAVAAYRHTRREANPLAEELRWTDEELLHSLGCLKRLDGRMRVTLAGLITFGRSSALRRISPAHRVDYIRVPGTQWVREVGKEFESTEMRGPLMTLVSRVIAAILDDLPKAFKFDKTESAKREEMPLIPVRAILEAVVNTLIHRNYQSYQPVQIVRYSNRVEFKNPGYSLKSTERFDDPSSVMRNPNIAEVMHETRFAETKGTGIRRMREFMEASGLSSPTFESDRDNDVFSAIFLFHHFLSPEDWAWLARFKEFELTDDQRRALIFVREVGAIDNQHYRSLTKTDTLSASKSLRKLRGANILADRGSGSRAYYVPGPEMISRLPHGAPLGVNSLDLTASSLATKDEIQLAMVPANLRKEIKTIHLGKRLTMDRARALLVNLCSWRALSGAQLATLLDMNSSYLTQTYLSALVREGQLRYLHPEQPNHPAQKYLSGKSTAKQP
jgi:ATP-dependent DNA helicase RecG